MAAVGTAAMGVRPVGLRNAVYGAALAEGYVADGAVIGEVPRHNEDSLREYQLIVIDDGDFERACLRDLALQDVQVFALHILKQLLEARRLLVIACHSAAHLLILFE
jgi:hypothetical protein